MESLCCVLEHFISYVVMVQPKKTGNHTDMTEQFVDWDVKQQN